MKALLISLSGDRKSGCGHCMAIPSVQLTYIDSHLLPICPWHCAVTEVKVFSFLELPPQTQLSTQDSPSDFLWLLLCTSKENWWQSARICHLPGKSLWPRGTITHHIKRDYENNSSCPSLQDRFSSGWACKVNPPVPQNFVDNKENECVTLEISTFVFDGKVQ